MALYMLRAAGTWNGGEVWNFTLHALATIGTEQAATAWADALTEAWSGAGTPAGALATLYSPDVVLQTATAGQIAQPGGGQVARADVTIGLPGTAVADSLPPQCAVVISLRTGLANRAGRGRFYLPATAVDASAGGRLSTAAQTTIANAMTRMFAALDPTGITPVIYGRLTGSTNTITSANVGDVYDTQRRRRNQLTETRMAIAV